MSTLDRAIDSYLDVIQPVEVLRQQQANARVIDLAAGINPEALAPHLTPLVVRWGPSDTGRWPIARSGQAVMLRACAETPPSSGPATVTVTVLTEFSGSETIATLTIPQNQQFGAVALAYDLPAGAWVGATVTTANGASGVSIALTVSVGGST